MGKLENIKKAVREGTSNKAVEYLLWYIQSLEDQLANERRIFDDVRYKHQPESNNAEQIAFERRKFDEGKTTLEEYEQDVKNRRVKA